MPIFQHGGHLLKDFGSASAVLGELGSRIAYLLDVVMSDYADDPAPVTSPIVGRAGSLTVTETNGAQISLVDGWLRFIGDAADYTHCQVLSQSEPTHTVHNKTVMMRHRFLGGGVQRRAFFQIYYNATNPTSYMSENTSVAGTISIYGGPSNFWTQSVATNAHLMHVLNGRIIHFDNDNGQGWWLRWPTFIASTAALTLPGTPRFNFKHYDTNYNELAIVRMADLASNAKYPVPELGTRDLDLCAPGTGAGTSSIATPVVGNTLVHTADAVIRYTITSAAALNFVDFRIGAGGYGNEGYYFGHVGGGVTRIVRLPDFTVLGNGAAPNDGDVLTLIAKQNSLKLYINSTLAISVTDSTWLTGTGGQVRSAAGGITDLTARTLDGIAQRDVTSVIDYGGNGLDATPNNVAFVGAQSEGAQFNGSSSYVNILAALNALGFDPRESTLICRAKNNLWDTSLRNFIGVGINPAGYLQIRQSATANRLEWYVHIGAVRAATKSGVVTTDWMTLGLTTSSSADEAKVFYDGAQEGAALTGFGNTYTNMTAAGYGAGAGGVGNFWSGTGGDVIVAKGVATPAQMLTIHTALAAGTLTDAMLTAIFPTGYVWYKNTERKWLSPGVTASSNHPGLGLATDVLAGPYAANASFQHEADAVLEAVHVIGSANSGFEFRNVNGLFQGGDVWWRVTLATTGGLVLYEYPGPTTRASTAAGVFASGDRLVVVANDETIKVYVNTTLQMTYSSAAAGKTNVGARVAPNTGAYFRNVISWPLKLASAALTPGATAAAAAFAIMETERG